MFRISRHIPDNQRMMIPLWIAIAGLILNLFDFKTGNFCYVVAITFAIQFGGAIRIVK